jgi:putative tryptophan/tyrosine transport system substrate-binding protein
LDSFHRGLGELGYVAGRDVAIEYRWAEGQYDLLPELAADLVKRKVNVIVANAPASLPAKAATAITPIVFATGVDPVSFGLVSSLSHPGGNVTGVTQFGSQLGAKRLELMHVLLPDKSVFAILANPSGLATELQLRELQSAAQKLRLQLSVVEANGKGDLDEIFAMLREMHVAGLIINGDSYYNTISGRIAALSLKHGVPAIYQYKEFATSGGLMSYGTSLTDAFHLVGVYTGRILNGEKPADLPVQQSAKFDFIINLKTAKALGIVVSAALLAIADEVIE